MYTSTIVDLNKLPKSIISKIPYSIRAFKNIYNINTLPLEIQYLIRDYLETQNEINYDNTVYDFIPIITEYGDLTPINDKKILVLEYLKNYLQILKGSYPFDIHFGSALKNQLQTRDTSIRKMLISNEIVNITNILSRTHNIEIIIKTIDIQNISHLDRVEYYVKIVIAVDKIEYSIIT